MTYINHKRNNDTHEVNTLAEFDDKSDAKIDLPYYRIIHGKHVYLSTRSTEEWRESN